MVVSAGGRQAFVTGGSGFIGGRLIERLREDGWSVRALARSTSSAEKVRALGAEPVSGDLDDLDAMREGARGSGLAFHAAAQLGEWGARDDFLRVNVEGTRNVLRASREAGVRRFVHVGTEAALIAGQPLVQVDETAPLRPDSKAVYCSTKAMAEQVVRDANGELETVVVRPRLVWGRGDTTILPSLVKTMRAGRFAWIGGGRHLTSTTHVDNAVQGLLLGAEKGEPGGVYFVTDGEPVAFRDFITELVSTQDVDAPERAMPAGVARAAAAAGEALWRMLRIKGQPPVTRLAVWLSSQECTIDISRARRELGYEPVKTREQGFAELRTTARPPAAAGSS
jgi:nucleoside-diphosphate-sugar epimerase